MKCLYCGKEHDTNPLKVNDIEYATCPEIEFGEAVVFQLSTEVLRLVNLGPPSPKTMVFGIGMDLRKAKKP